MAIDGIVRTAISSRHGASEMVSRALAVPVGGLRRGQNWGCAGLVTKYVPPSIDFFLTELAVAKIGANTSHVPPVEWPVHDPATGIDVEIKGALDCSEEAMASYNGSTQELALRPGVAPATRRQECQPHSRKRQCSSRRLTVGPSQNQ
jgi:hypothetical protein